MPKRTQSYIKLPWNGGINTAVDAALIPDNDLVQADNVIHGISGSRLKRDGLDYFDQLTVPTASSVAKSGTTITITFSEDVITATNKKFVVGESLNITCADSQYTKATATVTAIPGNDQIQYEVSVEPTAASTTLTSITRNASIVGIKDFWYFDPNNNAKSQYIVAVNSDAQIFKYSSAGERTQLSNTTYSVTGTAANDRITWTSHGRQVGDAISFDSITPSSGSGLTVDTTYYVASVVDANTITLASTRTGAGPEPIDADITAATISSPLYTTSINFAYFSAMNEKLFITFDGIGNFPKVFDPQTSETVVRAPLGAPPNASIISERMHLGRIWANEKEENEKLHYCSAYDFDQWNGYGNSGTINVGFGDGDPEGISSIFPPFKGTLFVTKRNNVYRLDGAYAEDIVISPVSTSAGTGCVSHAAVAAVDLDDVSYMSYKGIHSLVTTSAYGDFNSPFLSQKIQPDYNLWTSSKLKDARAVYIPTLNTIFWSVASAEFSSTQNDSLWLYNTIQKEWDRWPNINAKSVSSYDASGKQLLLLGGYGGRISKQSPAARADYTDTSIKYVVKTGTIYVDNNPNTMKAYKKLGFIFRPVGNYSFTATIKIDNYATQTIVFNQVSGAAQLGVDFILGQSILATANTLAPYMESIDGYGRGLNIKVENNTTNELVEIYGLVIEWEPAEDSQEVIGTNDL